MVVRRALPEDREFLAWSILSATRSHLSKGWFDISLDRPEADCLEFLARLTTTSTSSPWHCSRFLLACEVPSQPVAALCAVPAPEGYKDSGLSLLLCLKSLSLGQSEIDGFWARGAYLSRCLTPPDKGSLVIEVAATTSAGRNRGYLVSLLAHTIDDARSRGLKRVETSCFIGNQPAERAYARAGFTCAGEKRDPEFEAIAGAPGIRRFVIEL